MKTTDWLNRWQSNQIGFHEADVNTYLKRYISRFNLAQGDRVFMPLCGKARDIAWLADQGFEVIGVELSSIAIESFFTELKLFYQQIESDRFIIRKAQNITLLEGDYFDLKSEDLQDCQLIFDRAALIAIDQTHRAKYCQHMKNITPGCNNMLLITLDYDQAVMQGPPFAVPQSEVFEHYQNDYKIEVLEKNEVVDEQPRWRDKGLVSLIETVYELKRETAI